MYSTYLGAFGLCIIVHLVQQTDLSLQSVALVVHRGFLRDPTVPVALIERLPDHITHTDFIQLLASASELAHVGKFEVLQGMDKAGLREEQEEEIVRRRR